MTNVPTTSPASTRSVSTRASPANAEKEQNVSRNSIALTASAQLERKETLLCPASLDSANTTKTALTTKLATDSTESADRCATSSPAARTLSAKDLDISRLASVATEPQEILTSPARFRNHRLGLSAQSTRNVRLNSPVSISTARILASAPTSAVATKLARCKTRFHSELWCANVQATLSPMLTETARQSNEINQLARATMTVPTLTNARTESAFWHVALRAAA